MCGRFALTAPASTITEIFQVDVLPDLLPRYNIAPTQDVACVVEVLGSRVVQYFKWGLIPSWSKDRKIAYKTINARAETVAQKPVYRSAFKRRRLLILADGFYEWKREGKSKQPYLIQADGGRPFGMAGLHETWIDPESFEEVHSCTIITCGPNEKVAAVHDRMPVILSPEHYHTWLDPRVQEPAALQELLVPFSAERMALRPVNSHVNDARHQGARCQAAPEDPS